MTIYTKVCNKCKTTKLVTEFNKNKNTDDGLCTQCKSCMKEYRAANKKSLCLKNKQYYEANIERLKERDKKYRDDNKEKLKEYYETNKDRIAEYQKGYYEENKDQRKKSNKEYYEANKDQIREQKKVYRRVKYSTDVNYGLIVRIRGLIGVSLRRQGYSKKSRTHDILGCSYEEFKSHIENQFREGMSWENRDQWHIDHIIPVSYGMNEEEVIALNHYTNLQPLWAEENKSKSNKFIG